MANVVLLDDETRRQHPNIAYQPGYACDDGDNTTSRHALNQLTGAGTPTACTGSATTLPSAVPTSTSQRQPSLGRVNYRGWDADGDNTISQRRN